MALAAPLSPGAVLAAEEAGAGKSACGQTPSAFPTARGKSETFPPGTWCIPPRLLPPPAGASGELQDIIRESRPPTIAEVLAMVPKDKEGWKKLQAALDARPAANAPRLARALGVTIEPDTIAGVKVFHLIPARIDPVHRNCLGAIPDKLT